MTDFMRQFAHALSDFRSEVAASHNTMRDAVKRYAEMLDALDAMFLLHFSDMTDEEQEVLLTSFRKLASSVELSTESETNVHPLHK